MTVAQSPGDRGIPHDARVTQLKDSAKEPTSIHGHKNNELWSDFYALGRNVGIVLDGKFLVVDIDRPDADEARFLARRLDEEGTWRQRTPHGKHWLFRLPSPGSINGFSAGNGTLLDVNENSYGDIKTLGYIVAPGSEVVCDGHKHPSGAPCDQTEYVVEAAVDPRPVPAWVLEMHGAAVRRARAAAPNGPGTAPIDRRDQIPVGEHDDALAAILGQIARSGTARLSIGALERIARSLVENSAILAPSSGRPYGPGDYRRLAASALAFGQTHRVQDGTLTLLSGGLICGTEVDYVADLGLRWWVHNFIPKGELATIFARGGAGKSTAASWIASEVTRKGGSVAVLTVEESFSRFLARAVLGGADPARLYAIPNPTQIQFPRDVPLLREILNMAGIEVLYIDSIMSHFSHEAGENAAERARRVLGPLAAMAKSAGIAVIGVFHENKTGEFKGATEMVDVARHVIKVYRKRGGPAHLRVWKTNLVDPGYDLALHGREEIVRNPDGEVAWDEDESGASVPAKLTIVDRAEKVLPEPDPLLPDDEIEIPEGGLPRRFKRRQKDTIP